MYGYNLDATDFEFWLPSARQLGSHTFAPLSASLDEVSHIYCLPRDSSPLATALP